MKRLISLILAFSLVFSLITVPATATNTGINDKVSPKMAQAYLNIINSIIVDFGIAKKDINNFDYDNNKLIKGLGFAQLVDFDNDGNSELLCLYNTNDDPPLNIVCQVWGFDGKDAYLIYENGQSGYGRHPFIQVSANAGEIGITTIRGQTYLYYKNTNGTGAEFWTDHEYYTLENGNWKKTVFLNFFEYLDYYDEDDNHSGKAISYTKNDAEITESEYKQELLKFEKNAKAIVTDFEESKKIDNYNINSFLESLINARIPSNIEGLYGEKSLEEKRDLIGFLNNFQHILDFDISSIDEEDITYLLKRYFNESIDYQHRNEIEMLDDWRYMEVPEVEILKVTRSLFGIELKPKIEKYSFLKKDDKWYVSETADGGEKFESAQPINMRDLGNGMYYVEIKFYDMRGLIEYPDLSIVREPIEQWNTKEKQFAYLLDTGYAIIKEVMINGQKSYNLVKLNREQLLTEDQIEKYIKKANPEPNLSFDYSKVKDFNEASDYIGFFQDSLKGLKGEKPNDRANSEIATYIQYAIENSNIISIKSKRNTIIIDNSIVKQALNNAQKTKSEFDKVLKSNDISLNRDIEIVLKANGEKLNKNEAIIVTFHKSSIESLGVANGIRVLLGDSNHTVYINSKDLIKLIDEMGSITIQIQKGKNRGSYTIVFLDSNNKEADKLSYPISFSLPADSELATVFVNYKNGSDNWGGQYNSASGSIEFSTRYSGEYNILEDEISISDIGNLTEKQQEAIGFMVSKGYFDLEGDKFNGQASLNRYDFTTAIVKMFFALDRELETSFTDVAKKSKYYSYVASAQKDQIVKGFEDNTFRGEINIPKEQVIVLCGRTLVDKKGYIYPENPGEYLDFADGDTISNWALDDIAISVQNGLIDKGGILMPQVEISRAEAAEILYKLFMLLYEIPPITVELEEAHANMKDMGVVVGGIAAVFALGGGSFYYIKKRKISN